MTTFAWIILAMIAGVIFGGVVAALAASKEKLTVTTAWEKIRPAVMEVLVESIYIYQANQEGFESLVEYCVNYIKHVVDYSNFLSDREKTLITVKLIRSLIEPKLLELWEETDKE